MNTFSALGIIVLLYLGGRVIERLRKSATGRAIVFVWDILLMAFCILALLAYLTKPGVNLL